MTTLSTGRLSKIFGEAANTRTDDFDLRDFLHMLTIRTADLVGAAAVGMLLADEHDELQFMAASQDTAKWLELFQLQNHAGQRCDHVRLGRRTRPGIRSDPCFRPTPQHPHRGPGRRHRRRPGPCSRPHPALTAVRDAGRLNPVVGSGGRG